MADNKWAGKSRGNVLGYRIFVFFIKNLGVRSAYFILIFVAAYFFLFVGKSKRAIHYYFRQRLQYSPTKSWMSVYKSFYVFGQTILDKVAIKAGLQNQFTYEFDGVEVLKKMLAAKKGGVLISAHMGNFEVAEHFFSEIDVEMQINLVTTDLEHSAIKDYLQKVTGKSKIKFIIIADDLSHIFAINAALGQNEVVCFTGDRYFEGVKYLSQEILGEAAKFPAGPFLIASRLQVPVVFVYVMKEPNLHYHLYAKAADFSHRNSQKLLQEYVSSVEMMVQKYPYQWFNYFDFWEKLPQR